MSNYTSFEVSEKLWKAGLRPEEGHKTSIHHKDGVIDHIYGYKSIVGIDETIEETRLFPCYNLGQLVSEIFKKQPHIELMQIEDNEFATKDLYGVMIFATTKEDAAGELLIKILEAKG